MLATDTAVGRDGGKEEPKGENEWGFELHRGGTVGMALEIFDTVGTYREDVIVLRKRGSLMMREKRSDTDGAIRMLLYPRWR